MDGSKMTLSPIQYFKEGDRMPTGLILTYLVVLGLLYLLGKNCWKPLGLYFYNLIITSFNWSCEIPLNPFNSIFAGFLGIPGLASLVILKYWIKI
jgi:hypothetical protein